MDTLCFWYSCLIFVLYGVFHFWISLVFVAADDTASRWKNLAEKEPEYTGLLHLIQNHPCCIERTKTALRILNTLGAGMILSAGCSQLIQWTEGSLPTHVSIGIWEGLAFLLTGIVFLLLGEYLPERMIHKTEERSEQIVKAHKKVICFFTVLLLPWSLLLNLLAAVFSHSTIEEESEHVTEEDILMLVDAGNENGLIEEEQMEMINNIFEFDDMIVSEVMTHRTELVAVDVEMSIKEAVELARNERYSRMPVYEKNVDHIIGILNAKDLLELIVCPDFEEYKVKDFIREALYIPEMAQCKDVLQEMLRKKIQIAVVMDEYGGTAGLITMEDILEEIVGNIQDEYDEEDLEIKKVSDTIYTVDGHTDPEKVFETFGLEDDEDVQVGTISGFVIEKLGRIPEGHEKPTIEYKNIRFTVLVMEDNIIGKLKAELIEQPDVVGEDKQK